MRLLSLSTMLSMGAATAALVLAEVPVQAAAIAIKPSVSSITDNRISIVAKDNSTQFLKVVDYTQYLTRDGQPAWNVQGWRNIPSSTDSSFPDSATISCSGGLLALAGRPATIVVTRRANNGVYYALRGQPTGSGEFTQWPAWSSWRSTGGSVANPLVGSPSVAFTTLSNGQCSGMLFSRASNGAIFHNTWYDSGPPAWDGWHAVDNSPTDFVSDPDAVYTSTSVKVCARRSDNLVWCATRRTLSGPWTWGPVEQQWPVSSGPGMAPALAGGDSYELYATGSDFNIWANANTAGAWSGWYMIPHGTSAGDPDATNFVDLFNGNTLSRFACAFDYQNHSECFIYNPASGYGVGWFYTP